MERDHIYCGDSLEILKGLPDGCVRCCITSPPYWGLRDYQTGQWEGGDPDCDHIAGSNYGEKSDTNRGSIRGGPFKSVCRKCGALRVDKQIGLEEHPSEYISKMKTVFREVQRVLSRDGSLWLNLGTTYISKPIESDEYIIKEDISDAEYEEAMSYLWRGHAQTKQEMQGMLYRREKKAGELCSSDMSEVRESVYSTQIASKDRSGQVLQPYMREVGESNSPVPRHGSPGDTPYLSIRSISREKMVYPQRDNALRGMPQLFSKVRPEGGGTVVIHGPSTSRRMEIKLPKDQIPLQALKFFRPCYILKNKDDSMIAHRLVMELIADGWYLRSSIIWDRPNAFPESVKDRPTRSHEYIFLLTKSAKYFYNQDAIREPGSRYKWNTQKFKSGDATRHHGSTKGSEASDPTAGRNKRSVWSINTQPLKAAHFATFPEKLVEPCILAGSEPGDLILDPFMGAATVALVAKRLGRDYIGCELNPEYIELANQRLASFMCAA